MKRREALALMAIVGGGTIIGLDAFLSGCVSKKSTPTTLQIPDDIVALLDEIGDIIIPTTPDSPGAKEAHIGAFMRTIVTDCYTPEEQDIFMSGIKDFDKKCQAQYGQSFIQLTPQQRVEYVTKLDDEQRQSIHQAATAKDHKKHYFTMVKQLTIWGYFTSEVGATKALRYVPVPGRFDACIPYKKGDKAFA